MVDQQAAIRLSHHQRKMMIEHIDGPRAVVIENDENRTRVALMRLGFIKGYPTWAGRPQLTVLTDEGREALCVFLAAEADLLFRAHLISVHFSYDQIEQGLLAQTKENDNAERVEA